MLGVVWPWTKGSSEPGLPRGGGCQGLCCWPRARGPSPTSHPVTRAEPIVLSVPSAPVLHGCGELARCHFLKYQAFLYIRYSEWQILDVKSAVLLHNQIVKYELN